MKVLEARKRILRVASVILTAAILTSTSWALADSKPYFVANDGDVFTGGWFINPSDGQCETGAASYQAPNYSSLSTTRYQGAIMAFSDAGARVGAYDNLDAFALGMIEGSGAPTSYGFYTGLGGTSDLSFSNNNAYSQSNFWGGLFDGSNLRRDHCIPNYWEKRNGTPGGIPAAQPTGAINLNNNNGNYIISGSIATSGGTISPVNATTGRKLAYFVDGDLIIRNDIVYGAHNANNVPKFVLVVRGNIYIEPGVTRLDGWYIAQPTSGNNDGVIWTCHDGDPSRLPLPVDTWVRTNCNSALTINGALTAKQVNLLRITAGLGSSGPGGPGTSAENFNYTQQMVIGGPFFNQPPNRGSGLDSLISLPPVF